MSNITITLPKSEYDHLISENIRLQEKIGNNQLTAYIHFKTNGAGLKSIDLSSFRRKVTCEDVIPEFLINLEKDILNITFGINQRIESNNKKIEELKNKCDQYLEEDNISNKSFWYHLFH